MKNTNYKKYSEQGMYFVFMACCLLTLLTIVAVGLDLGKMHRDYLYAQKAIDAGVTVAMRAYASSCRADAQGGCHQSQRVATLSQTKLEDIVKNIAIENLRRANLFEHGSEDDVKVECQELFIIEGRENLYCTLSIPRKMYLLNVINAAFDDDTTIEVKSTASLNQANVILLLDTSGSMCGGNGRNCIGTNGNYATPADNLVTGVTDFVSRFNPELDNIGIITFSTSARDVISIGSVWDLGTVTVLLNNLNFSGQTNPSDAMLRAWKMLESNNFPSNTQFVFFTDGSPTAGRFLIRLNDNNNPGLANTTNPHVFNMMDANDGAGNINWDYFDPEHFGTRNIINNQQIPVGVNQAHAIQSTIVGDFYNYMVQNQNNQYSPVPLLRNGVEIASIPGRPQLKEVAGLGLGRDFSLESNCFMQDDRINDNMCVARIGECVANGDGQTYNDFIDMYNFVANCSYQLDRFNNFNPVCTNNNYQNIGNCNQNFTERIPLDGVQANYNGLGGGNPQIGPDGIRGNILAQANPNIQDFDPAQIDIQDDTNNQFRSDRLDQRIQCIQNNVPPFIINKPNLTDAAGPLNTRNGSNLDGNNLPRTSLTNLSNSFVVNGNVDKIKSCFFAPGGQNVVNGINYNFELLVPVENPGNQTPNDAFTFQFGLGRPNDNQIWQQQYFNTTIAYADAIRRMINGIGGAFYVIGLGADDPNIQNVNFYQFNQNNQDEVQDAIRKDFFLTRLALDPGVCDYDDCSKGCLDGECDMGGKVRECCSKPLQHREITQDGNIGGNAIGNWNSFGYNCLNNNANNEPASCTINNPALFNENRFKFGTYYPTNDASQLDGVFQVIADKILLSVSQ